MTDIRSRRDRDESGHPRNARPRDALGRPLPSGSTGVPRIPDDLRLPAGETLSYAQHLIDEGLVFHAHEVFEAAWKCGPDSERLLWRSLAQLAVGITHLQRGNLGGATALLRRAGDGLSLVDRPVPYSIDADGLIACAASLVNDLAVGSQIDPTRLRPQLTAS
jgi:uncharacterized protein